MSVTSALITKDPESLDPCQTLFDAARTVVVPCLGDTEEQVDLIFKGIYHYLLQGVTLGGTIVFITRTFSGDLTAATSALANVLISQRLITHEGIAEQLQEFKSQNAQLQEEVQRIRECASQTESQIRRLESAVEESRGNLEHIRTQKEKTEQEFDTFRTANQHLQGSFDTLQRLTAAIEEKTAQMARLETTVRGYESEIQKLQQIREGLDGTEERLRKGVDLLDRSVDQLDKAMSPQRKDPRAIIQACQDELAQAEKQTGARRPLRFVAQNTINEENQPQQST